jgi:hypothetical protein
MQWIKNKVFLVVIGMSLGIIAGWTATKTEEGWLAKKQADLINIAASNAVSKLLEMLPQGARFVVPNN